MNGYSKIKLIHTNRSRSIDLSDLLSSPQKSTDTENPCPNHTPKTQETKQIKITNTHESSSEVEDHEEHGKGERFGVILSRNYSVSSTASNRFRLDKQSTPTLQSAVKNAFTMRRSSSVSESYCRIPDHCVTLASPFDDHDDDDLLKGMGNRTMHTRSMRQGHGDRTAKILKACKRLFGL